MVLLPNQAYEKSLALDSLNADTHFELGNLNARLGRLNEAIQAYSASVTIDSSHYRARHNLAVIIADQGQLPQAIELLKELYDYISNKQQKKELSFHGNYLGDNELAQNIYEKKYYLLFLFF